MAAFGGYAVGPTLGATASATCPAACSGATRVDAGIAGLRAGYRFGLGISVELTGGYLTMRSAFTRTEHRTFRTARPGSSPIAYDTHPIMYELSDSLGLRGFFLGGGASYRRGVWRRLGFVARAVAGVLVASTDDIISATAEAGGEQQNVSVVGSASAPRSTPLFVWPEMGLDFVSSPLHLGAMVGAAFFPLPGPSFDLRQLAVAAPSPNAQNPGAVSNAPNTYLSATPERAYGPFALFTPHLFLESSF
jgi:hypothetical protein